MYWNYEVIKTATIEASQLLAELAILWPCSANNWCFDCCLFWHFRYESCFSKCLHIRSQTASEIPQNHDVTFEWARACYKAEPEKKRTKCTNQSLKRNGLLKRNDNGRVLILLACDTRRLGITLEHQQGLRTSTTIKFTQTNIHVHIATLFTHCVMVY